jgi:hypothetical protein
MLSEALAAHDAGLCVLPPKQDGSKRPIVAWEEYQHRTSTTDEIHRWYGDGRRTGLGVVLGAASGGLELFEFDDIATYGDFLTLAVRAGLDALVERIEGGYLEHSPNGIHWLWRCEEVTGNTKLARRPKRPEEMEHDRDGTKVLIETRGKGGFAIVAPTHGSVHPSGRPYERERGEWDTIATISPADRAAIFDLARTLDAMPRREQRAATTLAQGPAGDEERPGDWFNRTTAWGDVLCRHGWTFAFDHRGESYWRRPGKEAPGTSATTNYAGSDLLKVFSTSTPFDTETSYTRFAAYAVLDHGGDYGAAARALGERMPRPDKARRVEHVREPPPDYGDVGEWDDPLAQPEPTASTAPEEATRILEFVTAAELAAEVDNAPPVGWLCRPVWPADAYGVLAAEMKAGKTWAGLDLAISVSSATNWLGTYPVDTPGPVLVFLGEGGKRKMLRRARAICEARGVRFEDLPIKLCFRVPHLTALIQVGEMADEIDRTNPVLVIIDPLYLAARGAKSSDLIEMGGHLEVVQMLCQRANAALVVVHHWNKTGEGTGAKRMTGAGSAEWGRVLVSVSVRSRHTDPDGRTSVILDWEFMGDEIPEMELRLRRRVWADNADDLSSPMHYETEEVANDDEVGEGPVAAAPAVRRVLAVLEAARDWRTVREIGDILAAEGRPLKARTIQAALKDLVEDASVQPYGTAGTVWSWRVQGAQDEEF